MAPVEAFHVKLGLVVVTVGPGDDVAPGDKPVGIGGVPLEPLLTLKKKGVLQELWPAEFVACTFHA